MVTKDCAQGRHHTSCQERAEDVNQDLRSGQTSNTSSQERAEDGNQGLRSGRTLNTNSQGRAEDG
jgi:hypothetical protein